MTLACRDTLAEGILRIPQMQNILRGLWQIEIFVLLKLHSAIYIFVQFDYNRAKL